MNLSAKILLFFELCKFLTDKFYPLLSSLPFICYSLDDNKATAKLSLNHYGTTCDKTFALAYMLIK